jgi:hypothetical protein
MAVVVLVVSCVGAVPAAAGTRHPGSVASGVETARVAADVASYECVIEGVVSAVIPFEGSATVPPVALSGSVVPISDVSLTLDLQPAGSIFLFDARGTLGPDGILHDLGPPSISASGVAWAGGSGDAVVTGVPGEQVDVTLDAFEIDTNVGGGRISCTPVGQPLVLASIEIATEGSGVTYVARYDQQRCAAIEAFADGLGMTPEAMIWLGVSGFRAIAEAGGATPVPDPPPDEGACEFRLTWPPGEADAITSAAAAWGLDVGQLHAAGGWVVVVLVYRAVVGAG